ncbi:MAG: hypothetical protein JOZ46_08835 [Candidatus Dormibacteraeota bacterium]|nr:hypothetical protein [Candidatus Dormibacteraeota bacterium]MBV9525902.1 hypothetical protein [Candidatus Dormibacteraeota bacterium]
MTDEAGGYAGVSGEEALPAPPVPGTVRLMTDEPLEVPRDGAIGGFGQEFSRIVNRRPWLVPAALLGVAMAYLLVRRRR